jgi:hypothetical protein
VRRARVVEAGLDGNPQRHLAADADDAAHEPAALPAKRHEVDHLGHSGLGEEAGDEDVRLGVVELLRRPFLGGRGDAVVAPRSLSRMEPKTLGASKRGTQYQSIVPSVPTSAAVWRSPTMPCSAIGR